MAGLDVTFQNKAVTQGSSGDASACIILYKTQDAGQNDLRCTVTNGTGARVVLPGASSTSTPAQIAFYPHAVLTPDVEKAVGTGGIEAHNGQWLLHFQPATPEQLACWTLTLQADLPLKDRDCVEFTFTIPRVSENASTASPRIAINSRGLPGDPINRTFMFRLMDPPSSLNRNFNVGPSWVSASNSVYIRPDGGQANPKPDSLSLALSNLDTTQAITVTNNDSNRTWLESHPVITLFFYTIEEFLDGQHTQKNPDPGYDALAYTEDAGQISVTPQGNSRNNWKPPDPAQPSGDDAPSGGTFGWGLRVKEPPTTNDSIEILASNGGVQICLENIVTRVQSPFTTHLYVLLQAPGYNDALLSLPVIKRTIPTFDISLDTLPASRIYYLRKGEGSTLSFHYWVKNAGRFAIEHLFGGSGMTVAAPPRATAGAAVLGESLGDSTSGGAVTVDYDPQLDDNGGCAGTGTTAGSLIEGAESRILRLVVQGVDGREFPSKDVPFQIQETLPTLKQFDIRIRGDLPLQNGCFQYQFDWEVEGDADYLMINGVRLPALKGSQTIATNEAIQTIKAWRSYRELPAMILADQVSDTVNIGVVVKSFTGDRPRVLRGNPVTLSWEVQYGICQLYQDGRPTPVASAGTKLVYPMEDSFFHSYELVGMGINSNSKQVSVAVYACRRLKWVGNGGTWYLGARHERDSSYTGYLGYIGWVADPQQALAFSFMDVGEVAVYQNTQYQQRYPGYSCLCCQWDSSGPQTFMWIDQPYSNVCNPVIGGPWRPAILQLRWNDDQTIRIRLADPDGNSQTWGFIWQEEAGPDPYFAPFPSDEVARQWELHLIEEPLPTPSP